MLFSFRYIARTVLEHPWLTAIKKLCAHGKGPGDARSENKKIKYLAIERQIEKRDGKPFK